MRPIVPRRLVVTLVLFLAFALAPLPGQDPTPAAPPAEPAAKDAAAVKGIDAAHERWQSARLRWIEAMKDARESGTLRKGGLPPAAVKELEAEVAAAKAGLEKAFRSAGDAVTRAQWLLLARVREASREYGKALHAYEQYFRGLPVLDVGPVADGSPEWSRADRLALQQACITALNSKQSEVAARWMEAAIRMDEGADGARPRPNAVRSSYYPRVLIALDRWADLEKLATGLAAEEDAAARAAGKQFLVVALLNRGELGKAEPILDEMLADPEAYPQHQGWAVQGQLAILAGRGEFERGEALVRDYLARPSPKTPGNANEPNARRRLAFLALFLGKPAPAVHVDTWVGTDAALGGDPLAKWRGKVVLLDFWQPWCEPCRKAMPALVALQRAHPDELRVVGLCKVEDYGYDVSEKRAVRPIAAADYPAHVADFRKDMELVYPLGIEDAGANSRTYARLGIPTLVLIDRAGIVRYMSVGAGEPGTLEVAVEGVLKGPPRGRDEPAGEGQGKGADAGRVEGEAGRR